MLYCGMLATQNQYSGLGDQGNMIQFIVGLETRRALGPTLLHIVLTLRMHEGIPPLSICFMMWCLIKQLSTESYLPLVWYTAFYKTVMYVLDSGHITTFINQFTPYLNALYWTQNSHLITTCRHELHCCEKNSLCNNV